MSANEVKERIVLPGELLGTAEEFVPGRGTYEDGGRIYAALVGRQHVDPSDRAVRVQAIHAVPSLSEDSEILGRVDEMKSAMAIVSILVDAATGRGVPGSPEGTIHISKAKEGYTESLADEFAPGDIVRARVLQSHPSIKLTTAPADLGVISARCQSCHALLAQRGRSLECPRCGHTERRKTATGFGQVARKGPLGPSDGTD